MRSRLNWVFVFIAGSAVIACSTAPQGRERGEGGSGSVPTTSTGGSIAVIPAGSVDPNDKRDVPVRKKVCDAAGKCTCLRLALLGTLMSAATENDTQPFVDWLNNNSDGTATVTMVPTKPTLNADFLAKYDILVVANVNTWSFGADEKAAVANWVRESGGGIITLTGFVSAEAERAATSQLIEFAGFSYQAPETGPQGPSETKPLYYKGGSVDVKLCLHWSGTTVSHITAPIRFTPQVGQLAKLTLNLDYVGAFKGWTVGAPAGSTLIASDPTTNTAIAVAHEVDGKGRIYAFGDEWVIFANQWVPKGNPDNMQMDANNKCWHAADANGPGFFYSVQNLYQTKQFWFNAINWVAPPNECNFTVSDPDVIIR